MSDNGNNYNKDQKLILHQLQVLNKEMIENRKDHIGIREDIATLKVKSGLWGAIGGGLISSLIVFIFWIIKFQ